MPWALRRKAQLGLAGPRSHSAEIRSASMRGRGNDITAQTIRHVFDRWDIGLLDEAEIRRDTRVMSVMVVPLPRPSI